MVKVPGLHEHPRGGQGIFVSTRLAARFIPSPLPADCPLEADNVREREGPAAQAVGGGEGAAAVMMNF
jgi:hypothetical protein